MIGGRGEKKKKKKGKKRGRGKERGKGGGGGGGLIRLGFGSDRGGRVLGARSLDMCFQTPPPPSYWLKDLMV